MDLKIIDTGIAAPKINMEMDIQLLNSLGHEPQCLLHFYDWEGPCATYGYFSLPHKLLNPEGIAKYNLQISKRPTGGGVIFHQYDFAFSILLSLGHPKFSLNTLENYRYVNTCVAEAILKAMPMVKLPSLFYQDELDHKNPKTEFCMARPTIYDLVIDGRKVAGAAQRRTKMGFLHQGSISLQLPSEQFLANLLLPETGVAEAMQMYIYPLMGKSQDSAALEAARASLKKALIKVFLTER